MRTAPGITSVEQLQKLGSESAFSKHMNVARDPLCRDATRHCGTIEASRVARSGRTPPSFPAFGPRPHLGCGLVFP